MKTWRPPKNIELTVENGESIYLNVDKNATSTIFRNLLNNAIKFTEPDGKILIKASKDSASHEAVIQVIDSGVGIPKDKIKQLFDLNKHVSSKGTFGESGLGLGLQLVYDFVQLNKGSINVESEEGKGSTFTVRLPLAD